MPRFLHLAPITTLGLLLFAAPLVHAQTPPTPTTPNDPRAVALMTQMAHAYQSLKSYSAVETAEGPWSMAMPYRMTLTYARPDRVNMEVTRPEGDKPMTLHIVSDGTNYFASNSQYPTRYLKTTPPKTRTALAEAMQSADIKIDILSPFLEDGTAMLKYLTDPKNGRHLSMGKSENLDGIAVDTILVESNWQDYHGAGFLQIGHADHLLRRMSGTDQNKGQPTTTTVQTYTDVKVNPDLTASAFAFVPPPGAVAAAPAVDAKPDPKAQAVVSQMYAAYNALHSFSCAMHLVDSYPTRDQKGNSLGMTTATSQATYIVQKPNKIAFTRTNEMGMAQAVCDGQFLYALTTEDKSGPEEFYDHPRYLKKAAPNGTDWNDKLDLARFGSLPVYGGTGVQNWMPEVAVGVDFMPADGGYPFHVGEPATLDGEPTDVIVQEQTSQYMGGIPSDDDHRTLTLWISRNDHLLRQVRQEWRREEGKSVTTETYTEVKANPVLPPSTFVFTPPANGLAVDTAEALIPPRPVVGPTLHVGDIPPAAVFGATDTDGKPVRAADYRGKVVLLDFWATWCGPCNAQIPATVTAYQKYHGQGLEIVGYALEQAKQKDKMSAFVQAHGMTWREVWDRDAVIANTCGPTNGIPFAVVGRDGKIAALGNPGDDSDSLDVDAAIRAALAKP